MIYTEKSQNLWILHLTDRINFALIWCPPGEFMMGSPEEEEFSVVTERPQHKVKLSQGFWIGRTPVTQEQWELITKQKLPLFDNNLESESFPAEGMTWEEAMLFCNRLTLIFKERNLLENSQQIALPTEAQWEYACRACSQSRWYFGNDIAYLDKHGWYKENSDGIKQPVGRKIANSWGIYDLYGNVAEWCLDDFSLYKSVEDCATDPLFINGNSVIKIARGGAFNYLAVECRSARRESIAVENPYNESTGIRIVCVNK